MIRRAALGVLLAGCAGVPTPHTEPPVAAARVSLRPDSRLPQADRLEAARLAWRAGLMPLHATGVDSFTSHNPIADGRGVLVAILDSGIDPSVAGLRLTSDSLPKVLAVRDFTGESRISLRPAVVRDSLIGVGGHFLAGAEFFAGFPIGDVWAGSIRDSLLVVVVRSASGWALVADTDRDGNLSDERPLQDNDIDGNWLGWSHEGRHGPAGTVNLADSAGVPVLSLVFDNSGHGTHVAGIIAGNGIGGIAGFDGVAPGAQLLVAKVVNTARGNVTTRGAVMNGLWWAIDEARRRGLPLVVNLSMAVGNEIEGTAEADGMIDSTLAANPDVTMIVAASNDGPGLGTIGSPASARNVIAVGATAPLVFSGTSSRQSFDDPIASYSARGGELAGPTLVAPGRAWSTVPVASVGTEELEGTSMAAAHVSGLAARLTGLLSDSMRQGSRDLITQALVNSARPLSSATILDQGAGLPWLPAAARWLAAVHEVTTLSARSRTDSLHSAIILDAGTDRERIAAVVQHKSGPAVQKLASRSNRWWLASGGDSLLVMNGGAAQVGVVVAEGVLLRPGVHIGTLSFTDADLPAAGVLTRLPVTVILPMAIGDDGVLVGMAPGEVARQVFDADSGVGFRVLVETLAPDQSVLVHLHEPGGQPFRGSPVIRAGHGEIAGTIDADPGDVRQGRYEVVLVGSPTRSESARIRVIRNPLTMSLSDSRDSIKMAVTNRSTMAASAGFRGVLTGGVWRGEAGALEASADSVLFSIPVWARAMSLDVTVPREQWGRFTDFGVTLLDRDGAIIGSVPLHHAFGRIHVELPASLRGDTLWLVLTPAAASPDAQVAWQVGLQARFSLEIPRPLDQESSEVEELQPGQKALVAWPAADWSTLFGDTLQPLVTVMAVGDDGETWSHELPLIRAKELEQ